VKSREPHVLGLETQKLVHALAHLARRLVGEGDGEDALGSDATDPDQVGDPVGEDAGLSASRAGNHEERTLGRLHGRPLLCVQALDDRLGEHGSGLL
jgi:hypothetical protein